jgi:hypothetical protein
VNASQPAPPADGPEWLLDRIASGDPPGGLAAELAQLPAGDILAQIEALGRRADPRAASLLTLLAASAGSRAVRKEARRALHRLRAAGAAIEAPRPHATLAPPARPDAQRLTPSLARASLSDGSGSRLLWLLYERPLGGAYGFSMVLNEVQGVRDADLADTTRKRALERFARTEQQIGLPTVDLPTEYAEQLVGEADALSRQRAATLPREYQAYLRLVGQPPPAPTRALVYTALPTAETILNRGLISETPRLFELDELKGWFFDLAPLEPFVREWRQSGSSLLVLSPQAQSERRGRVVTDALRAVMTPELTQGLRRRFEESAYVLARLGHEWQARLLVAAAEGLDHANVTTHPLLRAMMERTLELGVGLLERQVSQPASEVS